MSDESVRGDQPCPNGVGSGLGLWLGFVLRSELVLGLVLG